MSPRGFRSLAATDPAFGKSPDFGPAKHRGDVFVAENYLYFCATSPESTELHFSRTLQEHEQAVAIYAPLWQQYDKERGIE